MEDFLQIVDESELGYARQRLKNRVFTQLVTFFEEEAAQRGISKRDLATALKKDAGQLNRILKHPSNLTLETISDLLVALDAEMETRVVRFSERGPANYMHPLLAAIKKAGEPRVEEIHVDAPQPSVASPSGATASRARLEIEERV